MQSYKKESLCHKRKQQFNKKEKGRIFEYGLYFIQFVSINKKARRNLQASLYRSVRWFHLPNLPYISIRH